jgi:hypothetical protein
VLGRHETISTQTDQTARDGAHGPDVVASDGTVSTMWTRQYLPNRTLNPRVRGVKSLAAHISLWLLTWETSWIGGFHASIMDGGVLVVSSRTDGLGGTVRTVQDQTDAPGAWGPPHGANRRPGGLSLLAKPLTTGRTAPLIRR